MYIYVMSELLQGGKAGRVPRRKRHFRIFITDTSNNFEFLHEFLNATPRTTHNM